MQSCKRKHAHCHLTCWYELVDSLQVVDGVCLNHASQHVDAELHNMTLKFEPYFGSSCARKADQHQQCNSCKVDICYTMNRLNSLNSKDSKDSLVHLAIQSNPKLFDTMFGI